MCLNGYQMYPYRLLMIFREKLPKMDKIQESADRQLMGHFRKISLFFGDTRDNQEHGAKNRLSIPAPSPGKLLAEKN